MIALVDGIEPAGPPVRVIHISPAAVVYNAVIKYKGQTDSINVSSSYGPEWAEVRAIAAFFHRHQGFATSLHGVVTFKALAAYAKANGLKIELTPVLKGGAS